MTVLVEVHRFANNLFLTFDDGSKVTSLSSQAIQHLIATASGDESTRAELEGELGLAQEAEEFLAKRRDTIKADLD
jgi:hypothetical protein